MGEPQAPELERVPPPMPLHPFVATLETPLPRPGGGPRLPIGAPHNSVVTAVGWGVPRSPQVPLVEPILFNGLLETIC